MAETRTATLALNLDDNLSAGMAKAASAMAKFQQAEALVALEANRISEATNKLAKFQGLDKKLAETTAKYDAQRVSLKGLGEQILGTTGSTKKLQSQYRSLDEQLGKTRQVMERQKTAAAEMAASFERLAGGPLNSVTSAQSRLRSSIVATTGAIRQQRAEMTRMMEAEERTARVRQRISNVFSGVGMLAGPAILHGAAEGYKAGAEVQSTRVDMQKAGIAPGEIGAIEARALQLSALVKNVSQVQLMDLAKEVRSVMTSPAEMMEMMEPLAKAKSLLDAKDSTGEASSGLGALIKGAENIGAAKDPKRLTELINGYVRGMQVMGKTINPEGIFEFDKYSKIGGSRLSDRFLMTTALSLSQEMGGSTAGKATGQLYKQISGGMQNLHSAAKEFARIGMIDPKNMEINKKTGEWKGTKAGVTHAVKGDAMAATDPDRWTWNVLQPMLVKAGIKSQADQLAWVQKAFPNGGVADLIGKFIVQRPSYESHGKQFDTATGTEGYKLNAQDPIAALGELTKSLETFAGVVTSPIMKDLANVLDATAGSIGKLSEHWAAWSKDNPELAKMAAGGALAGGLYEGGKLTFGLFEKVFGDSGLKGAAVVQLEAATLGKQAGAVLLAAGEKLGGLPGAGGGGVVPENDTGPAKPGAPKAGFGNTIAGLLALIPLAQMANDMGVGGANPKRSGWGGVLEGLDPGLADRILGPVGGAASSADRANDPYLGGGRAEIDARSEIARSQFLLDPEAARGRHMMEKFDGLDKSATDAIWQFGQLDTSTVALKSAFDGLAEKLGALGGDHLEGGAGNDDLGGGGGGGGGRRGRGGRGGGRYTGPVGFSGPLGGGSSPAVRAYVREVASRLGIDPDVAERVGNSEGLRVFDPNRPDHGGDRGTSFGPFQLHYGGSGIRGMNNPGLGDEFTRRTGLSARDSKTWRQQVDFALGYAATHGWGDWHGAANTGIGRMQGIGRHPALPRRGAGVSGALDLDHSSVGHARRHLSKLMADLQGMGHVRVSVDVAHSGSGNGSGSRIRPRRSFVHDGTALT